MFKPKPTRYAIKLMQALNKLNVRFKSESFDGYKHIDIVIPSSKMDIEIDGRQHTTNPAQIVRDLDRSHSSTLEGRDTIHVTNHDIHENIDRVSNAIAKASAIREERFHTSKKNYILFDFDGVIADSFLPAYKVHKTIHPHNTEENYRKLFEGNINHYNHSQDVHTDACRPEADWFEEYIPVMKKEVKPFPGMKDVVRRLAKEYTLIIISSTISMPIEEFLIEHNIRECFEWVMGNDVHPSKAEKIHMVFKKYNTTGSNCIFITDTLGDMRESYNSGVRAIGVTWGFNKTETLHRGNYYRLVNSPKEILVAVNDYFHKNKF